MVVLVEEVLDPRTAQRLAAAQAGADTSVQLTVAALSPGTFGVLDVRVVGVDPARTYKRGEGQGLLQRVWLEDATGRVALVLWDEETALVRGGPLATGSQVRIKGATVQPGYRGGIEVGLGGAVVEAIPLPPGYPFLQLTALRDVGTLRPSSGPAAGSRGATPPHGGAVGFPSGHAAMAGESALEGSLIALAPTEPVGERPNVRFRAEATLATSHRTVRVFLWDDQVRTARQLLPGTNVRIAPARPHPEPGFDSWWIVGDGATLKPVR